MYELNCNRSGRYRLLGNMELSKNTLKALIELQNVNILTDEAFDQLLASVVSQICNPTFVNNWSQICPSKPDLVKSAFAHVTCLLLEAAKHNYNKENLLNYLHSNDADGPRMEKLCDFYADSKTLLQDELGKVGDSLPHIVDVDWRLDYCVKSDTNNSLGMPLYHIRLSTKKYNQIEYQKFTCSMQQLQDLVGKLKDAVRHVEKIANSA